MNPTAPPGARKSRTIALAGFMGSGKTTVGSFLARQLAWRFVDLDARIEEASGLRITEIFDRLGEPAFREIEREQLEQALGQAAVQSAPMVLALGGGTYSQPANFELLRASGCAVVWLDCPVELLLSRCATMTGRPLFRDEQSFRQLYEQRLPSYRQANYRVETGGETSRVVEQILSLGILEPAIGTAQSSGGIIKP
ncbi:MAG TPA: shikimate kinase [Candidatus Acidoferrales bacterium]